MRRVVCVTLVLLALACGALDAADVDPEQVIEITYKDGTTEQASVRDVAGRIAESAKMQQRMRAAKEAGGTMTDVEAKTMKLDDVHVSKPELGGFIRRGQDVFKTAVSLGVLPPGSRLAGLATSDYVKLEELPKGEEYLIMRSHAGADGAAQPTIELHVKYLPRARIQLLEAWRLGDGDARAETIALSDAQTAVTNLRDDVPAPGLWDAMLDNAGDLQDMIGVLIGVGVACVAVGLASVAVGLCTRPARPAPVSRAGTAQQQ